VGVIDLPLFYEKTGTNGGGAAADTARLIVRLKQEGISGLILDLRRNGGGSVQEAIRLTGQFIRAGPVVQTRDSTGRVTVESSPDTNVLYSGPLVVLWWC
jgi:carboxyl-terminal processing protease